jgi:hypothetical protein
VARADRGRKLRTGGDLFVAEVARDHRDRQLAPVVADALLGHRCDQRAGPAAVGGRAQHQDLDLRVLRGRGPDRAAQVAAFLDHELRRVTRRLDHLGREPLQQALGLGALLPLHLFADSGPVLEDRGLQHA